MTHPHSAMDTAHRTHNKVGQCWKICFIDHILNVPTTFSNATPPTYVALEDSECDSRDLKQHWGQFKRTAQNIHGELWIQSHYNAKYCDWVSKDVINVQLMELLKVKELVTVTQNQKWTSSSTIKKAPCALTSTNAVCSSYWETMQYLCVANIHKIIMLCKYILRKNYHYEWT